MEYIWKEIEYFSAINKKWTNVDINDKGDILVATALGTTIYIFENEKWNYIKL